jgi:hypothetical protein
MTKKIFDFSNWYFDDRVPSEKRVANIRVHLKYINLNKVAQLTPRERVLAVDRHFKKQRAGNRLSATILSRSYKPDSGAFRNFYGVIISYAVLTLFNQYDNLTSNKHEQYQ